MSGDWTMITARAEGFDMGGDVVALTQRLVITTDEAKQVADACAATKRRTVLTLMDRRVEIDRVTAETHVYIPPGDCDCDCDDDE